MDIQIVPVKGRLWLKILISEAELNRRKKRCLHCIIYFQDLLHPKGHYFSTLIAIPFSLMLFAYTDLDIHDQTEQPYLLLSLIQSIH